MKLEEVLMTHLLRPSTSACGGAEARVLNNKPTPDAAAAAARLMASVIASHAMDAEDVAQLLEAIHGLAERFETCVNDEAPSLLN
jgi:hypothetical protein